LSRIALVENFDLLLEVREMLAELGRRELRFKSVKLVRQFGEIFFEF
jgi:hypothetical protein